MNTELEALIADRLQAGDRGGAATAALRGYGPQILGWLVTVLRDRETAEEVFADFSEQIWKGLGDFSGGSTFRTWAYAVAWHCLGRHRRDGFRRRTRRLATGEVSKIVGQVRSETQSFLKPAAAKRLERMREALDVEEHTLLVLRIDRGLSWREIADALSLPDAPVDPAALRKRFERLKERLRKIAESEPPQA